MRVLYDGIAFQNGHQRGVQRAFRELIDHLPDGVEATLSLLERAKAGLPRTPSMLRPGLPAPDLLPRTWRRALQPRLGAPALRRAEAEADVFHSTWDTGPIGDTPFVHTVHDLILERYSELCTGSERGRMFRTRRDLIERATRVIAISRATADELARFYPGAEGKTRVVHWGCDHLFAQGEEGSRPAEPAYALFVGERGGYKNFRTLLDAIDLDAWPSGVGLTVAGPPWRPTEAFRVELLSRRRRIELVERPSDEAMASLLRGATCLISPSVREGFGFPVLEAQSAGVPVVCSDIPVYREVVGESGLRFNPHEPEDLAGAVTRALDPGVRSGLLARAAENRARFSWDRCARETVAVYREAAGG